LELQHFKPRLRKQILNSQPDIQPMDTLQNTQKLRNHPIIFFIFPEIHYISNFKIIYGLFLGLLGFSWVNKRTDAETVEIQIRIRTVVVLGITSTSELVPFSFLTNHHY
jgi:hypothetical protein